MFDAVAPPHRGSSRAGAGASSSSMCGVGTSAVVAPASRRDAVALPHPTSSKEPRPSMSRREIVMIRQRTRVPTGAKKTGQTLLHDEGAGRHAAGLTGRPQRRSWTLRAKDDYRSEPRWLKEPELALGCPIQPPKLAVGCPI